MYRKKLILFSGYLGYAFLVWFFKENIKALLLISMPLREMYSPSIGGILLFYLVPLLVGYSAGKLLKKKDPDPPIFALLFFPLFLSVLLMLPILTVFLDEIRTDPNLFITLGYSFLLIPVLLETGSLVNYLGSSWLVIEEESKPDMQGLVRRYLPIICLALLVALLNTVPLLLSQYPVGFDVWSHAAISGRIAQGGSLFQHPYFFERTHYYAPLVHFLIAKISQVTQYSVLDLWRIYLIPLSAIFILLFFLLSLNLTKSYNSAFLATLFILPWYPNLWLDAAPRLFALCLLLLMLIFCLKGLKANKKFFIPAGLSFVGIFLSHFEIAAHAIIIIIVMTILAKYHAGIKAIFHFLVRKTKHISSGSTSSLGEIVDLFNLQKRFYLTLLMYVSILVFFVTLGTTYYNFDKLFTVSEIGLSFLIPMGSISSVVFLFSLPTLLSTTKHKTPENIVLLSIAFLYTSVFFYFTHLWQFYHSYFTETAYLAFAVMAAMMISKIITYDKRTAIVLIISVVLLMGISILPRLERTLDYAPTFNRVIENNIILRDIEKLDGDAVILANPNDMINRYIPAITGKYIFCGRAQRTQIRGELLWPIINDLAILGFEKNDSQKRVDLGEKFFQDPSILDEIHKEYRVTHILVTEEDYYRINLESNDRLDMVLKNGGYILLAIKDN